jgi:glutathione synthase/RimK-type ligase-like ATP-grasp enzyme
VKAGDSFIEKYDAVFAEIPVKNAAFGRVLLETIEEKGIEVNNPSTAYFTASKKNYLYYTLKERDIPSPDTVSLAAEKAARDLQKHLKLPMIAKRLENLDVTEEQKLESVEEIEGFYDGTDYEEDVLLFQEFSDADMYRCLVIGDDIISLREDSDDWRFRGEKLKYSNLSDDQRAIVKKAQNSLGMKIAEIFLRGDEVYDIKPNPDLDLYSENAGKDIFSEIAGELKEES